MKIFSIVLFLMLVGCSSPDESKTELENETAAEDRETVFDPLVKSLDRAKALEDIVMQQKRDMDAALKRMEGGEEDPEE